MILVGIDDTDIVDHPGTNQLARHMVSTLDGEFHGRMIVRHQLFFDDRVPYTSGNGSASIWLEPRGTMPVANLIDRLRQMMIDWCPAGSDPGLCVAQSVPEEVSAYAHRCQTEIIEQEEPRALAAKHDIHLEGLGGTEGGVIGALAAVGLAATQASGRIVHLSPVKQDLYDITGHMAVTTLREYGIEQVWNLVAGEPVTQGIVDIPKRLRPNLRDGQIVLYVEPATEPWCDAACWTASKVK